MLGIAVGGGEGRVMMPIMKAAALFAALALLAACGDDAAPARSDGSGAVQPAMEGIDLLEDRVGEVEDRMADLDAADNRVQERLRRATRRLWHSLATLRDSLRGAKDDANSALDDAGAALSRVEEVARDFSVLSERYDYHLKRYHGGRG